MTPVNGMPRIYKTVMDHGAEKMLGGGLNLSRSLGDFFYKINDHQAANPGVMEADAISSKPTMTSASFLNPMTNMPVQEIAEQNGNWTTFDYLDNLDKQDN